MVVSPSIVFALFILFGMWLGSLTYMVWRTVSHYNQLTRGVTGSGLTEALRTLLHDQERVTKNIETIEAQLRRLDEEAKIHIQRIGIVRFNPFSDTGGSQSFTLAFLDGNDNGIVMTSLYARSGNRWYVKEIRRGKGKELELSKEELTAMRLAVPVRS